MMRLIHLSSSSTVAGLFIVPINSRLWDHWDLCLVNSSCFGGGTIFTEISPCSYSFLRHINLTLHQDTFNLHLPVCNAWTSVFNVQEGVLCSHQKKQNNIRQHIKSPKAAEECYKHTGMQLMLLNSAWTCLSFIALIEILIYTTARSGG